MVIFFTAAENIERQGGSFPENFAGIWAWAGDASEKISWFENKLAGPDPSLTLAGSPRARHLAGKPQLALQCLGRWAWEWSRSRDEVTGRGPASLPRASPAGVLGMFPLRV